MLNKLLPSTAINLLLFWIIIITLNSCADEQITISDWKLVTSGQNFPEGVAWGNENTLYSSNCNGNWITKITNGIVDTFVIASDSTFSKTNGLLALKDGSILACDHGSGTIIKFSKDGKREVILSGFQGKRFNRPNDLTLDKNGNLYFTDPKSYSKDKNDGRIFFYNFSSNNLVLVQDSLAFPNGIGISPINNKLHVCESAKSRILQFERLEDGNLINKKVFVELPGGDPDGFNFDVNGNMYVAHFGGGVIYIISPEGKILNKVNTPGSKPSNVEFGGKDLKTLYITEDETNSIYSTRVSIPGHSFN